jgi:hypothetical protein
MLYCHIALICYIAFILLHFFDMLHCIFFWSFWAYKSWFWYATLSHCFDMLHCFCSATFLWYATLLLFCCIALMCYIITLLWYATLFLICCIALIWCIALICYISTLLNDESGLSETSVATWTNIIVQLRFQLRTTQSKWGIQLSSSLSQSRWSFLLLLCHCSTCKAFSDGRGNNTTLYFSTVCIFDRVQDNKLSSLMKKMSRKTKQQSFIWIDSAMSSLECLFVSCPSRLKYL